MAILPNLTPYEPKKIDCKSCNGSCGSTPELCAALAIPPLSMEELREQARHTLRYAVILDTMAEQAKAHCANVGLNPDGTRDKTTNIAKPRIVRTPIPIDPATGKPKVYTEPDRKSLYAYQKPGNHAVRKRERYTRWSET